MFKSPRLGPRLRCRSGRSSNALTPDSDRHLALSV
jgi:hypothetical protein